LHSALYESGPPLRGLLLRVAFVEAGRFLGGQVLVFFLNEALGGGFALIERRTADFRSTGTLYPEPLAGARDKECLCYATFPQIVSGGAFAFVTFT
jgi:hypothetical protein